MSSFSSAVSIPYFTEIVCYSPVGHDELNAIYRIRNSGMQPPSLKTQNLHRCKQRKRPVKKVGFIFEKVLDFLSLLWYVVVLTGGTTREKYDSLPCAFALLRSELVATP